MTFSAVDFFAGCGGLSQGLKKAGFKVGAAVEIDQAASVTYRANHADTTLFNQDILTVKAEDLINACAGKKVDLLAGCAPCQGFCSLTAKNEKEDPRNTLVLHMAELIAQIKPTAIMMENVPGLAVRGKEIFDAFLRRIESLGYKYEWKIVQMADYGIPQSRRRLVLLAGLGFSIPFPKVTHAKNPPKGSKLKKWRTLRDAIGGMGSPVTFGKAKLNGGPRKYKWHVVRDMQPQVLARLKAAVPGKTWTEIDESIRPECHKGGYTGFTNTYGRMSWKQTPVAMTGGCTTASKGRFGHPNKTRTTISVREAALIQTFPKYYKFETELMEAACDMVGNAVPPQFSFVASKQIRKTLESRRGALAKRRK